MIQVSIFYATRSRYWREKIWIKRRKQSTELNHWDQNAHKSNGNCFCEWTQLKWIYSPESEKGYQETMSHVNTHMQKKKQTSSNQMDFCRHRNLVLAQRILEVHKMTLRNSCTVFDVSRSQTWRWDVWKQTCTTRLTSHYPWLPYERERSRVGMYSLLK